MTFSILPLDRQRTLVRTTWLVHADAEEGKTTISITSPGVAGHDEQDASFVAETRSGIEPAVRAGPLESTEFMVGHFHRWYVERMRRHSGCDVKLNALQRHQLGV